MNSKRYNVLDCIRGFALLNMIAYHTIWDLVYLFGIDWKWYHSQGAYIWQQGICWIFIFLSGFCWSLSKHPLKRGIIVFCGGALISCVTILLMPQNRVLFGVLTLIGSCMILVTILNKILQKIYPLTGMSICWILFIITRSINDGYLGFEKIHLLKLPKYLYQNLISSYLGFPKQGFYSTDYFSIIPWFFLFLSGYYLFHYMEEKNNLNKLAQKDFSALSWFGKHSFILYMIHQPIIYIILELIWKIYKYQFR